MNKPETLSGEAGRGPPPPPTPHPHPEIVWTTEENHPRKLFGQLKENARIVWTTKGNPKNDIPYIVLIFNELQLFFPLSFSAPLKWFPKMINH